MKMSKIKLSESVKKNLPTIVFILIIPLGILVGYFFSNISGFFSGGYRDILRPINRMRYVAKVDGVAISRGEWEKLLKSRYGKSAASELIDKYMIKNQLKKANINVSEDEINAEIAEIEKQLAGQSLEEILSQQGQTLSDLRENVYLTVGMKKLLSHTVVVTDQDIEDYIKSDSAVLTGTTDEEKTEEARKILTEQKYGEEINKWYTDLRSKAIIENYLEDK